MDEPQPTQIRTESIEEDVDRVQHQEIDTFTNNLNFGSLSSFDFNSDLKFAQNNDTYIISNVATQAGIAKALEHGVKLSSIVKAKALRLNEATILELLDAVVKIYCRAFAKEDSDVVPNAETRPQPSENDCEKTGEAEAGDRDLDFTKLSKFFSSKVICYSPLTWETLPRIGNTAQSTEAQPKRKRTQAASTSHIAPRRELTTMQEYHETLEIQKHTNAVMEKLIQMTQKEPINFWEFVLEDDPVEGYTKTCLNIYALTFLTVKGFTAFKQDQDGEILLQGSGEPNQEGENSQGIVTALSYDKWLDMINKYKKSQ